MPINNITQTISTLPPAGKRGVDVQTQFVIKQEDFQDHLQGVTVDELNTLKDQLNLRIGEINSTATTMNGYASTASAGASTATTKAGEASTSASDALSYKNQAETFKNNASASATKASQWSDNNYNVEVETGKYSAKHWATVAQNTLGTKVDKVTSTDNAIVRFNGTTGDVQNSGVTIDDNGNVGIGTSTPTDKLHIGSGTTYQTSGYNSLGITNTTIPAALELSTSGNTSGAEIGSIFFTNQSSAISGRGIAQIKAINGSNSASGNLLVFTQGGSGLTEKMRIDSAGNVGIGTSTPTDKLHIENSTGTLGITLNNTNAAGANGIVFKNSGTANWTVQALNDASKAFRIYDYIAGSERMRIDSSGNVGIGTSTPSRNLEVLGDTSILDITGTNQVLFAQIGDSNRIYSRIKATTADYPLTFWTGTTERMRIGSSGNVGIGTSSPVKPLHVANGAIKLTSSYSGHTASDGLNIETRSDNGDVSFVNYENTNMVFYNNATEKMRIDSSGNVGIGTTPSAWSLGKALEIGYAGNGIWVDNTNEIFMSSNAYYNNGFKYGNNGYATMYKHFNGTHEWRTAPSGTTGNPITWTNAMTLDASGVLSITSNASNGRINVGASNNYIYGDTVNNLILGTAGSDRVTINNAGNVGIGTTPSAWYGTYKALQINNTSLTNQSNVVTRLSTNYYIDSSNVQKYIASDYATQYTQANGNHMWYTAPSGTAGSAITWNTAMTLGSNGNLLIGTSTDNGVDKLQVNGTVMFSNKFKTYRGTISSGTYFDIVSPIDEYVFSGMLSLSLIDSSVPSTTSVTNKIYNVLNYYGFNPLLSLINEVGSISNVTIALVNTGSNRYVVRVTNNRATTVDIKYTIN